MSSCCDIYSGGKTLILDSLDPFPLGRLFTAFSENRVAIPVHTLQLNIDRAIDVISTCVALVYVRLCYPELPPLPKKNKKNMSLTLLSFIRNRRSPDSPHSSKAKALSAIPRASCSKSSTSILTISRKRSQRLWKSQQGHWKVRLHCTS